MQDIDFLLISDPKIWAMTVCECRESLVDLKNLNFTIRPNPATAYAGFTKVRQAVANKLLEAGKYLPAGILFYFSEGHRPLSVQRQLFTKYYAQLAHANPAWEEKKIKYETTKYVAPPEDVPPHSTGGAIDITLIDANGNELDMGSILDETPDKNANRNFTYADNISDHAKANRQLLITALSKVGFINYPTEWWHWSYGDKYWAYHAHHPHAIYGSVE
jgi:D-alanyl-D-alanine dipeptidase